MASTAVDRICDAFISLLSKKPIEDISVKELVATAKISRSSYNYHFYSIEDVLDEIFDRIRKDLAARIYNKPFESGTHKHHYVIRFLMEGLYDMRSWIRVLMDAGYKQRLYNLIISVLEESARRHKLAYLDDDGQIRSLSNGAVYDLYISENAYSIIARIDFWLSFDFDMPIEEALKVFRDSTKIRNQIRDCADKYYESHNIGFTDKKVRRSVK